MNNHFDIKILVISKSAKGQVFFRRLLQRQHSLMKAFGATHFCPRVM